MQEVIGETVFQIFYPKTNWNRNRRMVDLSLVPQDIQDQVLEDFSEDDNTSRDKLFNYFVQNKLKNLMEHIGDF